MKDLKTGQRIPLILLNTYCIDSCNILSQRKLPNVVFNLAEGISTERFPLRPVIFDFIDENTKFFLLDNTSGMDQPTFYGKMLDIHFSQATFTYPNSLSGTG